MTPAIRDNKQRLTPHGMRQVILSGGGVLPSGDNAKPILKLEDLPSETSIAVERNDPAALASAEAQLAEKQRKLDAEKAELEQAKQTLTTQTK